MKKFFTLVVVCLTTISTWAYDVEVDGIYYNLNTTAKTAEVTYKGASWNDVQTYSGSVIIPENIVSDRVTYDVTSIGEFAFHGWSGLTSVTIPNSVISIGYYAFGFCTITSISFGSGVASIGNNAFECCSGLTSITIPSSVWSIGSRAFNGCSGLSSIKVESGNTKYDSRQDCNAIIETSSNTLILGCKNTIIPNSVTSIGEEAFHLYSDLTSIAIPNSVTSIEPYAFRGCSGLTSVAIPNSMTSIGESAFEDCSGLTSIAIPNSVTSIGNYTFKNCSGLTSITIPNSVTSIGVNPFASCSGLSSIKVESGNTKYDSRQDCNAIIETSSNTLILGCKNTIIPNSVTSVGNYAFSGCSSLTYITIPNSVTSIGNYAFYGVSGITSITIPNSVSSIGELAFILCI